MSDALDHRDLSSFMARGHAARCAACQAFAAQLTALDARLAREAHVAATPVVVVRQARWSVWSVSSLRLAAPLAVAAAAVVALLVVGGGEPPATPTVEGPPPAVLVSEALGRVRGVADRVSQVLARTPLETELDALIDDSKRGLDAVLDTGGLRYTETR